MITIYLIFLGLASFVGGAAILGTWLRRHPSRENAERTSRIMHFLFFAGLNFPLFLSFFYPGFTNLDSLLGLKPLPWKTLFFGLGILLAIPGLYYLVVTNRLLRTLGSGANAFRLTRKIVNRDVYTRSRNPMSLGFYMLALSLGMISGSTFITLYSLFGLIPAHLFFLKYFEEQELAIRFGESYIEYKKNVPFLFPRFGKSTVRQNPVA